MNILLLIVQHDLNNIQINFDFIFLTKIRFLVKKTPKMGRETAKFGQTCEIRFLNLKSKLFGKYKIRAKFDYFPISETDEIQFKNGMHNPGRHDLFPLPLPLPLPPSKFPTGNFQIISAVARRASFPRKPSQGGRQSYPEFGFKISPIPSHPL